MRSYEYRLVSALFPAIDGARRAHLLSRIASIRVCDDSLTLHGADDMVHFSQGTNQQVLSYFDLKFRGCDP